MGTVRIYKALKMSYILGLLVRMFLPPYQHVLILSSLGRIPEAHVGAQCDQVPGRRRDGVGQHAAQGQGWRDQSGACLSPGHHSLSSLQR